MNLFAPKSKTAPHPIFWRHSRAPRALDGGRSRRRCCRTCSATRADLSHGPFPMTRPATPTARFASAVRHDRGEGDARFVRLARRAGRHAREERTAAPLFADRPDIESFRAPLRDADAGAVPEDRRRRSTSTWSICRRSCARMYAGDFDATRWDVSTRSEPERREAELGNGRASAPTGQNFLRYSNPKVDALLDSATRVVRSGEDASVRVARVPDDHRRRSRPSFSTTSCGARRESPHQRRADARRRVVGQPRRLVDSRRTSASIAIASDSRPPKP